MKRESKLFKHEATRLDKYAYISSFAFESA